MSLCLIMFLLDNYGHHHTVLERAQEKQYCLENLWIIIVMKAKWGNGGLIAE